MEAQSENLSTKSIILIGFVAVGATVLCGILWGLPWWIPVHLGITITALALKTQNVGLTFIGSGAILGLDLSVFAWGFPLWIPALTGILAVALIVLYFTPAGSGTGRLNPIPILIIVVASRLFVSLLTLFSGDVDTIPACNDFLDIITGCADTIGAFFSFVFGSLPGDAPAWINLLVVFTSNGLLIWAIMELIRG